MIQLRLCSRKEPAMSMSKTKLRDEFDRLVGELSSFPADTAKWADKLRRWATAALAEIKPQEAAGREARIGRLTSDLVAAEDNVTKCRQEVRRLQQLSSNSGQEVRQCREELNRVS